MTNIPKQKWLYFDGYVHLSFRESRVLLYNTLTGVLLDLKAAPSVVNICKKSLSLKYAGVIPVGDRELKDNDFQIFLSLLREYYMGDLIDASQSLKKPVQMTSIPKIQKDVRCLKRDAARSVGDNVLNCLSDVTLYLNNTCGQKCSFCNLYYKQIICCYKEAGISKDLDISTIEELFRQIQAASITNLNICGGNPLDYVHLNELLIMLTALKIRKNIYIHSLNLNDSGTALKFFESAHRIFIIFTYPCDGIFPGNAIKAIKELNRQVIPVCLAASDEDFFQLKSMMEAFQLEHPVYLPVFNGANPDFFKANFFLSAEDIRKVGISTKDIYINEKVNKENFGQLTITADGSVYANMNERKLGVMKKQNIPEMITRELIQGKSWLKIRKNVTPCKKCLYRSLCPPISNYNRVMGRFDFCTLFD